MAKIKLTAGRIADFTCPAETAQAFLWDADAPGLAIRATAGAKAYIFQGKLTGKTIRATIGDIRTWSISDARTEARRLQTLIDQGIDPRQQKADKAAEAEAKRVEQTRQNATVAEAWTAYIQERTPKWSARHLLDHMNLTQAGGELRTRGRRTGDPEKTKPGLLTPLLPLRLADLDADRVKLWLKSEAATRPTQSALAFRILRAFVRWCAEQKEYQGYVHVDACSTRIAKDTLPKAGVKDDCLQREQLPGWFAAVRAINNPVISAFLQGLLLTGARREELAGLRWEDVDFRWQAMTIRDKVEGERTIPLCPYLAALLAPLPRRNEWVFSSPAAESGRLQEPGIQSRRAAVVAGVEGLTLHGLRRSFGTLAEWVECPAGVAAQIMGHKPSAIAEKHYRRRPLDLLRVWHSKIEAWILEQAGIEFDAGQNAAGLRLVTK